MASQPLPPVLTSHTCLLPLSEWVSSYAWQRKGLPHVLGHSPKRLRCPDSHGLRPLLSVKSLGCLTVLDSDTAEQNYFGCVRVYIYGGDENHHTDQLGLRVESSLWWSPVSFLIVITGVWHVFASKGFTVHECIKPREREQGCCLASHIFSE